MSAGVGSADTGADQERRRRLCRRPGAGMSRVPIRLRLTLGFAVAMAAVLAAMGVFVYLRVGATLLASVDQTLRSQSAEAVSHVRRGERGLVDRDVAGGTTLAQLLDRNGAVVESSPHVSAMASITE